MVLFLFLRELNCQNIKKLNFKIIRKTRQAFLSSIYGHVRLLDSIGFFNMLLDEIVESLKDSDIEIPEKYLVIAGSMFLKKRYYLMESKNL